MLRIARRLMLGPLLAICASGAVLVFDAGAASAATSGTIKIRKGTVQVRSAPTAASTLVRTLRNRAKVAIDCKVYGQVVKGTVRKSGQWDRLSTGGYVPHAYVQIKKTLPTCPPPPPPAASRAAPSGPLTTASNAAFIAAAAGPAQASQREFRVPASVTIAQAILESSWGKSGLAFNDRNYFGMKCHGTPPSPGPIAVGCHNYQTWECNATTCWQIIDSFRIYGSVTDSFRDHGRQLATMARYAAAFNYQRDPNQFAAEIHRGGYATDPQYTNKLIAIMVRYNLYAYDLR